MAEAAPPQDRTPSAEETLAEIRGKIVHWRQVTPDAAWSREEGWIAFLLDRLDACATQARTEAIAQIARLDAIVAYYASRSWPSYQETDWFRGMPFTKEMLDEQSKALLRHGDRSRALSADTAPQPERVPS